MLIGPDGIIHHYNGLGNNRCEDFSMIKRVSRDDGATWSQPKIVHRFPIDAASPEQPAGKPRMDAADWANGAQPNGSVFDAVDSTDAQ